MPLEDIVRSHQSKSYGKVYDELIEHPTTGTGNPEILSHEWAIIFLTGSTSGTNRITALREYFFVY